MNEVGNDYDFGNVFLEWGLVNATSDSKQLGFWTSDKSSVIKSFDERMIWYVHM